MTNWTLTTPFTGFASPAEPARPTGAAPLAGPRAEALPQPEREPFGFGRAVPLPVGPAPEPADRKEPLGLPALPSVDEHAWSEALEALADPPAFRPTLTLVSEPAEAVEETEERVPVWRTELSFRRADADEPRADEAEQVEDEATEAEGGEVVHLWPRAADEDHRAGRAAAAPPAEPEPAADEVEPAAEAPAEAPAAEESGFTVVSEVKAPFWRRELSFRRTPKTEPEPQGEPEPVLEAPVGVEVVAAAVPFETEAAMVEVEPVEEPAAPAEPVVAAAPEPVQVEPVVAEAPPVVVEPEPEAVASVPAELEIASKPEPDPTPVAAEPAPVFELPEPVAAEPAPEPMPEPVAVQPEPAPPAPAPTPAPAPVSVPTPVPVATTEDATPASGDAAAPAAERRSRFGRGGGGGNHGGSGRSPRSKRGRRGRGATPKRLVGLKIGGSQIAGALVLNEGTPEVAQLARIPFDPGIVVDGDIRDPQGLTAALKRFFDETKLPRRDVRIGLASNRVGVRTFDIAGVEDEARFDNAVRFKAHEVLPIALDESVLDYRVLSERPNEDGELTRRVLLVVAPREQVEPYVHACREAGVRLAGIDLEAFALLRTFVDPRSPGSTPDGAAQVVVAVGHESSTLVVSGGGVCEFTRVIGWGGGALDSAIASSLEVPSVEANTVKERLSLRTGGAISAGLDEATAGRALDAVRGELTSFARELVSSLQFYQRQPDSLGIGDIVVTGGTAQLDGLDDALRTLIGVPVRVGDPLARVVAGKTLAGDLERLGDRLGSLAVAIGLGIEDESARAVNLLPGDVRTESKRKLNPVQVLAPAGIVVPLAVVGALAFTSHGTVSDRKAELQERQAELAALPLPNGLSADPNALGQQAARAATVASVITDRIAWDGVLSDLARVLPSDVWLESLHASSASSATAAAAAVAAASKTQGVAGASDFRITGFTYDQTAVARLLARLETLPSLAGVRLESAQRAEVGGKRPVQFTISATVRKGGEGA